MSMTFINVMIKANNDLTEFETWTGDVDELARLAGQILAACGLTDAGAEPTVRVIRDYAQRGIVSRANRQGKEALYAYRQLLELVAARVLVNDKWPLVKIAEQLPHMPDAELRKLIPGDQSGNRAVVVARRLRGESPRVNPRKVQFSDRAARLTGIEAEMREFRRRLGLSDDAPLVEQLTVVAVAPWCQVYVKSDRLPRLTIEEAEEVGRAVTAGLLAVARKGTKP
jgi:hypothetical protein